MTLNTQKNHNERKYLTQLCKSVGLVVKQLDDLMMKPSTVERGKEVARWINYLELENDRARHFGLGQPLKEKP